MITRMDKYTLFTLSSYSAEFIASLQEIGVVDIRRSHKPVDAHSEELMARAASIKSLMAGTELKKEIAENKANLSSLEKELKAAQLWGEYDKETIVRLSEAGYTIHFHELSAKKFNPEWEKETPLAVISDNGKQVFFVTVCAPGQTCGIPGEIQAPRPLALIEDEISTVKERLSSLSTALKALPEKCVSLQVEYESTMSELDAYLARKGSVLETEEENGLADYLDIYEGYAPTDKKSDITGVLDAMPIFYTVEEAVDDDTPIKLHNNWFAKQFEVFTGMYGMPVYGEFDPTPILAPFYLLFFGMCMGDAGYGIILMLIALFLGKKMPESGLGKMHNLIFLLGAGTFVIGAVLGTFFGINLYEASWTPQWLKNIMPVEGNIGRIAGFDPQIIMALAIGIFHICLAMVVKTACYTKHYGFMNSLSTWGWTILVVGGVTVAALAIGGILGGEALKWTIIVIGALSALGILVFNNPKRNPLINIGAGLWDTYSSVTGLLSDMLSYIRLYALGLAGGMLGGVFNSLATMMLGDNPTWQWLPFALLLLVGHALNIALSALGAFVHPLRLSFVEYFKNSGYEGKGRKYQPLSK